MKSKRDIDSNILDRFWELVSASDETRIKSSELLLAALAGKQAPLGNERSQELDYVVKRLIRGLASGRECARLGYSTVLTSVLRIYHLYSWSDLLRFIKQLLKVSKSDSKADRSGAMLGHALTFLSIVQSDYVSQMGYDEVSQLVEKLLSLRQRKAFLMPLCTSALAAIAAKLNREMFRNHVLPHVKDELSIGWKKCTADSLQLLLAVIQHKHVDKSLLKSHWDCKKILTKTNHQHLARIIAATAVGYPIVHPVCDELIRLALDKGDNYFAKFWLNVVSDGLMLEQTHVKKSLYLSLTSSALSHISTIEQVKVILSPRLLSCVIQHTTSKDPRLVSTCQHLLSDLVQFMTRSACGQLQITVLQAIICCPASVRFDQITKTKTTASLVNNLNADGCRLFAYYLIQLICGCDKVTVSSDAESIAMETRRKWAVNNLSSMITHQSMLADDTWQQLIIQFLFVAGFFDIKQDTSIIANCTSLRGAVYSDALRQCIRDAFFRALNRLATFNTSKQKTSRDHTSFVNILYTLAHYTQTLLSHADCAVPLSSFTDEALDSWTCMLNAVDKIKSKESEPNSGFNVAFELLFLYGGFQLFVEPVSTCELLQELHVCYKKASRKKRQSGSVTSADGNDPEWVDVIVDLLMSQLSEQRQLVRTVVNCAFLALVPQMSSRSLQLIIDVLKPDENTGDILEFSNDEADDENAEDNNADASAALVAAAGAVNRNVSVNGNSDDKEMPGDDDSSSSSSEDEPMDEDVDDNVDDTDRQKVKMALGEAAVDSEVEAEESDLDDEAMFRLDGILAAAFKSMKKGKKVDKEKETQLKNYKMRCLELLELFVQHTTSADLLVYLLVPLLDLIQQCYQQKELKDLSNRTLRVLNVLCHPKKLINETSMTSVQLFELLSMLCQRSSRVSTVEQTHCLVSAFVFIVHVILGSNEDNLKSANAKTSIRLTKVLDLITAQINDFCLKRDSNISHIFVQGLFDKQSHLLRPVIPTLSLYITSENVRVFCRTSVCLWLTAIISRQAVEEMGSELWNTLASDVVSKILKVIMETEVSQMKPKYTVHLLNLMGKVLSVTEDEHVIKNVIPSDLTERLLALRKINSDVRTACNRLTGILQHRLKSVVPKDKLQRDTKKRKIETSVEVLADDRNVKAIVENVVSKKRKLDKVVSSDSCMTSSVDKKSKKFKC